MTGLSAPLLAAPVTGSPISQAYLTSQVYNPLTFALNPPSAFLYASAATTLTTAGSSYLININTASFDPYGAYASNAWVVPITGVYEVEGVVHFAGNASGNRAAWITTDKVGLGMQTGGEQFNPASQASTMSVNCGGMWSFNQGQTIALAGYQSSGGSLSTTAVASVHATLKIKLVHL